MNYPRFARWSSKGRKPNLDAAAAIVTLKEMAVSGMPKVDIAQALGISRASWVFRSIVTAHSGLS